MRGLGYEGREKVVEEGDHVNVAEFGGSPGRRPVPRSRTVHLVLIKETEEQMEGAVAPDSWENTWA